jgi:hypothetical protein
MKKKLFISLTLILSVLLVYSISFTFIFLNLENFLHPKFKNKQANFFYKNNSQITNHLRQPEILDATNKNLNEYIFSYIGNNKNSEVMLFQGDSWFQQIYEYESATQFIKNNLEKYFTIINAGSLSFSPSLMSVQLTLLKNKFNIKPSYLIVYIDQTDLGDENCRYRYLKKYDVNGKLVAVPYEENPTQRDIVNPDIYIQNSNIFFNNESKFIKTYSYINYKITKFFIKIKKSYQRKILNKNFSGSCPFSKIQESLIKYKSPEINYFKDSLIEYLNKVERDKNIKNIFIVTHPHKKHLVNKKFEVDVSDIVAEVLEQYPKIFHINFSKKIKENPKLYDNLNDIWLSDESHLKEEYLVKVFLFELLKDLKNILKL